LKISGEILDMDYLKEWVGKLGLEEGFSQLNK
jgi:hypothetical protein